MSWPAGRLCPATTLKIAGLALIALLFPFLSFTWVDESYMLLLLTMPFSLLLLVAGSDLLRGAPGRFTPLPSPRGSAALPQQQPNTRKKQLALKQSRLVAAIYLCWGVQLSLRGLFYAVKRALPGTKLEAAVQLSGSADSPEVQDLYLAWHLENTVEMDPTVLTLTAGAIPIDAGAGSAAAAPGVLRVSPATTPVGQVGVSIVLPCLNEHPFVVRTVSSILQETSPLALTEIIVVDDANTPPIRSAFEADELGRSLLEHPKVKIQVNEKRQGLIRSKQLGGDIAKGEYIIFLDAHVKPSPRYLPWLLKDLNADPTRIVVPSIPILSNETWSVEPNSGIGYKMMFDWQLRFHWFEDDDDEVPIMSGGLLAMTRSWWKHTQGFDRGMDVWGAENIEQSIKTWMANGSIIVNRESHIAHFFRPKFPYAVDQTSVTKNKLRVASVWFDKQWFRLIRENVNNPMRGAVGLDEAQERAAVAGNITDAVAVRREIAGERPFNWWIDRFRPSLLKAKLVHLPQFLIHRDGKCLSVRGSRLSFAPCDPAQDIWVVDGNSPREVFPHSELNQFFSPHEAAAQGAPSRRSLPRELFCEESPVCRKHGGYMRNVYHDKCLGAVGGQFEAYLRPPLGKDQGLTLSLGQDCLRDGSYREYAKNVGFLPEILDDRERAEWERLVWRKMLPKSPHMYRDADGRKVAGGNLTLVAGVDAPEAPRFAARVRWGSLCIRPAAAPLAVVCGAAEAPDLTWSVTFVNDLSGFWDLDGAGPHEHTTGS